MHDTCKGITRRRGSGGNGGRRQGRQMDTVKEGDGRWMAEIKREAEKQETETLKGRKRQSSFHRER